ncbi:MAG: hypothetical protein HYX53_09960 [Chloroflexi bacterium]|nr:hypothetical protein [Chloroflexota bacterium]
MELLVIVPAGTARQGMVTAGARVREYAAAAEVIAEIESGFAGAVLLSDGIAGTDLEAVAAAVRRARKPVIEVRNHGWDGMMPSPLSAACRGVISGFGPAGVQAALAVLLQPAAWGGE